MRTLSIFYKQLIFILVTMLMVFLILIISLNLILPRLYKDNMMTQMIHQIEEFNNIVKSNPQEDIDVLYLDYIRTIDGRLSMYDTLGSPIDGASNQLPVSLLISLNNESIIVNEIETSMLHSIQIIELKEDYIYIYVQSLDGLSQTLSLINRLSIYILIFGIILSIIMALLISRRLTIPIRQLIAFTESEDAIIEKFHRKDEFNTLMMAFSNMKKHLHQNIQALKIELEKEKKQDVLSKTFIANVSHEIRTPLAVIQSAIEMVTITQEDNKKETYFKMIQNQILLLERLSQDILVLSKLQSHTMKLHLEPLHVREVINEVIDEMMVIYKEVDVKVEKLTNDVIIEFDYLRLKQVFTNVLKNAIKFRTPHTPIEISYQIDKNDIELSIYNQSHPILAEDLPYLMDTFYKVQSDGFGLGLSIVKNIMESHQGEICIRNYKKGVEVTLRFKYA